MKKKMKERNQERETGSEQAREAPGKKIVKQDKFVMSDLVIVYLILLPCRSLGIFIWFNIQFVNIIFVLFVLHLVCCTHSNVQNIEHDHNMRRGMFPSFNSIKRGKGNESRYYRSKRERFPFVCCVRYIHFFFHIVKCI